MTIHNEKLILNKLSQVETLLGVASSILSELKAELVATRAKSVQFEVIDERLQIKLLQIQSLYLKLLS